LQTQVGEVFDVQLLLPVAQWFAADAMLVPKYHPRAVHFEATQQLD
jgi:hypothetical protein